MRKVTRQLHCRSPACGMDRCRPAASALPGEEKVPSADMRGPRSKVAGLRLARKSIGSPGCEASCTPGITDDPVARGWMIEARSPGAHSSIQTGMSFKS
jgi:hypothetical protein